MSETFVFLLVLFVPFFFMVRMIVKYTMASQAAETAFFEQKPLHTFWDAAPFMDLPRKDYGLIACTSGKTPPRDVAFTDERGSILGTKSISHSGKYSTVRIEADEYQFVASATVTRLMKGEEEFAALRRAGMVSHSSNVRMATGEELRVIADEKARPGPLFEPQVRHWKNASGEVLAVIYKPVPTHSFVRVIALRKDTPPNIRAAVLGFCYL